MNKIINLVVKLSGAGFIWDKVDGYKTKGAGVIAILTGLLGVLTKLAGPLSAHDAAGVWNVVAGLPNDPAWLMLVGGVGALGLAHKAEKAAAPAKDAPAA